MQSPDTLPNVRTVELTAPLRWLSEAWGDLGKVLFPCLTYGCALALFSAFLVFAMVASNLAFWVWALICGFVFVAPILAMGLYEAGRLIERGGRPKLSDIIFVRSAFRQDLAYLGLALLIIFLMWGGIAQIVYGLSTHRLHKTLPEFVVFAIGTPEGHVMLVVGAIVGGPIAFLAYCLVVVSAPMLLDRQNDVFVATVTSIRAVVRNPAPMILWAGLLAGITFATALTGFLALTFVFPWLSLASWRAYRDLVSG